MKYCYALLNRIKACRSLLCVNPGISSSVSACGSVLADHDTAPACYTTRLPSQAPQITVLRLGVRCLSLCRRRLLSVLHWSRSRACCPVRGGACFTSHSRASVCSKTCCMTHRRAVLKRITHYSMSLFISSERSYAVLLRKFLQSKIARGFLT